MRKSLYILAITIATTLLANAQQKPTIGWFEENQLFYNPAAAGSGEDLKATMLIRNQWAGFDNSPQTISINTDMPLGKGIGAGIDIYQDQVGAHTDKTLGLNGSYRLYLSSTAILQMGLKAGLSFMRLSNGDAFQFDNGDPLKIDQNTTIKRIGIGALLKLPNYYIGISSPDFRSIESQGIVSNTNGIKTNYSIMAGGNFEATEYFAVLPSTNINFYNGSISLVLNLGVEINQTVVLGASFINPTAFGLYGKMALTSKVKFGYRHEFRLVNHSDELNRLSSSELLLTYGFN